MTKLQVYLNFNGNTEEVFKFYRSVFGGDFYSLIRFKDMPIPGMQLPADVENKIMHISLPIGPDSLLMASDALESLGHKVTNGNNTAIFVQAGDKAEADRIFNGLSAGGQVEMPMADQPWGDYYGSFQDQYGIRWMVAYSYTTTKKPFIIERTFMARPSEVWKAWTESEKLKKWWGPRAFTAPVYQIDLKVGGRYLNCMRSSDGMEVWSTGKFLEIDPGKKLVLTDSFGDAEGNVVSAAQYGMPAEFPLESVVTITFDEDANGYTRFKLYNEDVSAIPDDHLAAMKDGWNESFDKLEEYLKE